MGTKLGNFSLAATAGWVGATAAGAVGFGAAVGASTDALVGGAVVAGAGFDAAAAVGVLTDGTLAAGPHAASSGRPADASPTIFKKSRRFTLCMLSTSPAQELRKTFGEHYHGWIRTSAHRCGHD